MILEKYYLLYFSLLISCFSIQADKKCKCYVFFVFFFLGKLFGIYFPIVFVVLLVGDACKVTDKLPGICRTSDECEPVIDPYIKSGVLSLNDVPSCGLTPWGEMFCCPTTPCCPSNG